MICPYCKGHHTNKDRGTSKPCQNCMGQFDNAQLIEHRHKFTEETRLRLIEMLEERKSWIEDRIKILRNQDLLEDLGE